MANRLSKISRAGQFAPFDALKGLTEELALREQKRLLIDKKELSEEQSNEISYSLSQIKNGDQANLTFFYKGHYIELNDKISKIKHDEKYLIINDQKILFEDIYKINKEE